MTTTDWASYITKVKASGVDAVYISLFTNVIPLFTKQAHDFGFLPKNKLVSAAAPGPVELEAGGESCHGIVTSTSWSWDINTASSDNWEKRYWEIFKPRIPSHQAVYAYVGAMLLFNGIEKAKSTDVEKVANALKGISLDGPYGVVRISQKDNCSRQDAILIETTKAPSNPFGAKVIQKVLRHFRAEELGPPE